MPRFVVLLHETPAGYPRPAHFDLMLEHRGALRTWALDRMPAAGQTARAERLPDHRLAYLDYEGEVAGDRGRVTRHDAGEYEVVSDTEARLVVVIRGGKLDGTLILERTNEEPHLWRVSLASGETTPSFG